MFDLLPSQNIQACLDDESTFNATVTFLHALVERPEDVSNRNDESSNPPRPGSPVEESPKFIPVPSNQDGTHCFTV